MTQEKINRTRVPLKTRAKSNTRRLGLLLVLGLAMLACALPTPPQSPTPSPAPPSLTAMPEPLTATPQDGEAFFPLVVEGVLESPISPLPSPTQAPPPTQPPPTELPPPVPKPSFGIQIDPNTDDLSRVLRWVEGLGFGWVKVQVQWAIVEQQPNAYRWEELDRLVNLVHDFHFSLLIGVVDAPGWLRAEPGYNGPPSDPAEFGRFMGVLASRYAGRVAAYELWNEPNLAREWYGATLDPAGYVALLAAGSQAVRGADAQALVISAAPAVTGIDDGVDAIDDRRFLREMLAAGAAQWVDGIGVHPYGYANPPGERAADAAHRASAWNDHPSFFFLDTLEDYHAILVEAGVDAPLWPTEFGWPAAEGIRSTNLPPDFPYPYAAWVTEQDQADYLVSAARLMRERPWVGPFFIWNLNMSAVWGRERPESLFSLLRLDTAYRPAYIALRLHRP
mgnify:CR=1 FL=1